jgi:myo-inositol-1(or 4)-monophosphatase
MEELNRYADFARTLADAARHETLPRWMDAGAARNKAGEGKFDPVTEADIAAERAIRALIEREFPDHGIAGEEFPDRPAHGPWTWSLDPIDGTRSFVCGMPTWVTLIGLLHEGEPILGAIDVPRLDERYVGYGDKAVLITATEERTLRTSGCTRLAEARFSATDPFLFAGLEQQTFERLRARVRTTRYGHDGYAYARLAAGSIDLVVESGLQPYDYNALIPVIRAAGGSVGNWEGGSDMSAGRILAAATPELFEEVLDLLRS